MEMALLIHRPVSAATFGYFDTPKFVDSRNRDRKCDDSRHDHSAKDSNKERECHFSQHHSIIEIRLPVGPNFWDSTQIAPASQSYPGIYDGDA